MMNLLDVPEFTEETIKRMEDFSFFTFAKIFDDLLIVSQLETSCFVLKTTEGLIVIDAIWPSKIVFDKIIDSIKEAGWNPKDIKKVLFTHGHVDHTGCGKFFIENFGAKTYMSKTDEIFWSENPTKPDRPETWKDFDIDFFIDDKDTITLGNKTIYVYSTPGHTPGCLSYIFPVMDGNSVHFAGIFGGTTPPWNKDGIMKYMDSVEYFSKMAKEKGVDVALSNHTAIDNGIERIAYSKKRTSYLPNIYILGTDGFEKYCNVFRNMSKNMLKKFEKNS